MKYDITGIGQKVGELRKENGMSLERFGKVIGVNGKAVYTWERGQNEPRLINVVSICDKFNIDILDLITPMV